MLTGSRIDECEAATLEAAKHSTSRDLPDWFKDIPPLPDDLKCLKCASALLTPRFHTPILAGDFPEHLLWTCNRCGAMRYTLCADHGRVPSKSP